MDTISEKRISLRRPPQVDEQMRAKARAAAELEVHDRKVRADHYLHWLALITVGLYGWQLHGVLAAIGTLVGLIAAISFSNSLLMLKGKLSWVRANRWLWVIVAGLSLALSATEVCQVGTPC